MQEFDRQLRETQLAKWRAYLKWRVLDSTAPFLHRLGPIPGDAVRPEFARTMVQGDPHPIAKYRVIGPLSNLPEFAAAFQCPKNAPMVRAAAKRCEVW
jgi:predicted metalloendopeptidase